MALARDGFRGFVPWKALQDKALPSAPGVYMVLCDSADPGTFLDASPAGWFKGKNPTVDPETLSKKWVESAAVVYIGKATDLRKRLRQFSRHGHGKPEGHWGGRYIWQLADAADLLVVWKEVPDPREEERRLLADFRREYDRIPFANLRM